MEKTLPMILLQPCNIVYDAPSGQVGLAANARNTSLLVQDDNTMKMCGEAFGVSW